MLLLKWGARWRSKNNGSGNHHGSRNVTPLIESSMLTSSSVWQGYFCPPCMWVCVWVWIESPGWLADWHRWGFVGNRYLNWQECCSQPFSTFKEPLDKYARACTRKQVPRSLGRCMLECKQTQRTQVMKIFDYLHKSWAWLHPSGQTFPLPQAYNYHWEN